MAGKNKNGETSTIDLNEIISLLPEHVYWKNRDCVLLGGNTQQAIDAGFSSREDLVGKTAYDLISKNQPEEAKREQAAITDNIDKEVMLADKATVMEEFVVNPDGSTSYFSSHKAPLHNSEGEVIGLLGISSDITHVKQAHAQTSQLLSTLINHFRSYFEANSLYLSMISGTGVSDKAESFIQAIQENNVALESTLNYMSECIKLENNDIKIDTYDFQCNQLLIDVAQSIATRTNTNVDALITYEAVLGLYMVSGSVTYLKNVLELSLTKVLEYASDGYINLNVHENQTSKCLELQISYTGKQLSDETIDKLFTEKAFDSSLYVDAINLRYSRQFMRAMGGDYQVGNIDGVTYVTISIPLVSVQAHVLSAQLYAEEKTLRVLCIDSCTKRAQSIKSQLVNADFTHAAVLPSNFDANDYNLVLFSGGEYLLDAAKTLSDSSYSGAVVAYGQQSSVNATSYIDAPTVHYISRSLDPEQLNQDLRSLVYKKHVLLVEDSKTLQNVVKRILVDQGYIVDTASNGSEGCQLALEKSYDIILMDVGLPDFDGVEATQKILESIGDDKPLIVAFTGLTSRYTKDSLENLGIFDGVVVKGENNIVEVLSYLLDEAE